MGHKMYNEKEQPSNGQNPSKEVLLLYIKTRRLLQRCCKFTATKNEYTTDLGLIISSKDRSNTYLSTIQPPMKNPLRVFSKTPCARWGSLP